MTDPRLERLFASLDASFDAALAREEDEAATDLGVSLRHDLSLADVVSRGSWSVRLTEGALAPVVVAGRDFVGADGFSPMVVRADHAVLQAVSGPRPRATDMSLLELLRIVARRSAEVQVEHAHGRTQGRLSVAGPDYLIVDTAVGRSLLGVGSVAAIAFRPLRWADVL